MKRSVRVQMNFVVDLDDDGMGVPFHPDIDEALVKVAKIVVPSAVRPHPKGKFEIGLTRESINQVRKADKARSR